MEKRTLNIKAPANDKTGLGRAAKNIFDMMKNNLSNEYKITIEPITLENKAIRRSSKIKIRSGASRFMLHRKKIRLVLKRGNMT